MKPYHPHQLPLKNIDWSAIVEPMGIANRYVARYDGLLQSIINPQVLLSPLRTQEAVLSSKIEGTQATLEEVMEFDAKQATSARQYQDIQEVINYRKALLAGKEQMDSKPLTLNLIRQMHHILMSDVRGSGKDPGNFRRVQNWIGKPGSKQEEARFVPPAVPQMKEALSNWEKYIHMQDMDVMVQLAIIHAQFEIIHPFLDGNGRIGRILIPLFLYHKRIIHEPVFYMSQYLESNRQQYYDALKNITDHNQWTSWIHFFLKGIIQQAENNSKQARLIQELYENYKARITEQMHSQFSIQCLDYIFSNPVFSSSGFQKDSGVPKTSASRLIKAMEQSDMIECFEKGAGRRPSYFVFRKLLDIINQ
jgi:Fic family protein